VNASDAAEVAKLVSGAVWLFGRDRDDNPRDGWDPESIARALSDVALSSVSLFDVKLAAAACWSDKDTERPGRLAENGNWWPRSGSRSPLQRSRDIREEDIPARDRARSEAMEKAKEALAALARNEPQTSTDQGMETL